MAWETRARKLYLTDFFGAFHPRRLVLSNSLHNCVRCSWYHQTAVPHPLYKKLYVCYGCVRHNYHLNFIPKTEAMRRWFLKPEDLQCLHSKTTKKGTVYMLSHVSNYALKKHGGKTNLENKRKQSEERGRKIKESRAKRRKETLSFLRISDKREQLVRDSKFIAPLKMDEMTFLLPHPLYSTFKLMDKNHKLSLRMSPMEYYECVQGNLERFKETEDKASFECTIPDTLPTLSTADFNREFWRNYVSQGDPKIKTNAYNTYRYWCVLDYVEAKALDKPVEFTPLSTVAKMMPILFE
jgi:hypothetical protein